MLRSRGILEYSFSPPFPLFGLIGKVFIFKYKDRLFDSQPVIFFTFFMNWVFFHFFDWLRFSIREIFKAAYFDCSRIFTDSIFTFTKFHSWINSIFIFGWEKWWSRKGARKIRVEVTWQKHWYEKIFRNVEQVFRNKVKGKYFLHFQATIQEIFYSIEITFRIMKFSDDRIKYFIIKKVILKYEKPFRATTLKVSFAFFCVCLGNYGLLLNPASLSGNLLWNNALMSGFDSIGYLLSGLLLNKFGRVKTLGISQIVKVYSIIILTIIIIYFIKFHMKWQLWNLRRYGNSGRNEWLFKFCS